MNKKITEALAFIERLELKGAVLAIPFAVGIKDTLALRDHPQIGRASCRERV